MSNQEQFGCVVTVCRKFRYKMLKPFKSRGKE